MSLAAKLARLLLVGALLVAQHSALAHGVAHLAQAGTAQQSDTENGPLCDQHSALGTVLGALASATPPAPGALQPADTIPAEAWQQAAAAPLAPSSRDPPVLL